MRRLWRGARRIVRHHQLWGSLLIIAAGGLFVVGLRIEAAGFWEQNSFATNVASSVVTGMFGLGFLILAGGPLLRSVDEQRARRNLDREVSQELAALSRAARRLFGQFDEADARTPFAAQELLHPLMKRAAARPTEPAITGALTWEEIRRNSDLIEGDARIAEEVVKRAGSRPGSWVPPDGRPQVDLVAEIEEAWSSVKDRRSALRRAGLPFAPRATVAVLDNCLSDDRLRSVPTLPSYLRGTLIAGQLLEHARSGLEGSFIIDGASFSSLEDLGALADSTATVIRAGCLSNPGIAQALWSLSELAKTAVWMAWVHGSRHAPEIGMRSPADDLAG